MRFHIYGILCAALALAAVSSGCGGGSSSAGPTSHSYLGTQAPGDVWNITINPTTFTATNQTTTNTYSGNSALVTSGFYKLNVLSTTDAPALNTAMYAFQVPGVGIIAAPTGTNTSPVLGAALGSMPTASSVDFNWITVPRLGMLPTEAAYGTAHFNIGGVTATGSTTGFQIDGTPTGSNPLTFTNNSGTLTTVGGATGVFTQGGLMVIDNGPGLGGIVGMMPATTNVDAADVISRHYLGVHYKTGNGTELVWAEPNGSGALQAGDYLDVDNDVRNVAPLGLQTLTLVSQPSPGMFSGTVGDHNGTHSFTFAVSRCGGKYMIFGVSVAGGVNSVSNFLLMEK